MDTTHKEVKEGNGNESKLILSLEDEIGYEEEEEEEENESQCLLPPRKGGMMSRSSEKVRRSVQWNDDNGDNLVEVLVYEPSEVSEMDEDETDSCICTIM